MKANESRMILKNLTIGLGGSALLLSILLLLSSSADSPAKNDNQSTQNSQYSIESSNMPQDLNFAGEPVPIGVKDIYERVDREFLVNTYWHSNTLLNLKRSGKYLPLISKILKEEGIPDDFKYMAIVESGLSNVTSPAGASGYWQFIESTAEKYGLEVNNDVDERRDLEKSTRAACAFIKEAKERTGSWTLAAASFNRGTAGILRALEHQEVKSYYDLLLNPETSRYVPRLIATKYIYSSPQKYGFEFDASDAYQQIQSRDTLVNKTISDLVKFAKDAGTNYKTLKILNPWLLDDHLPDASGKKYVIKLPLK